MSILNDEIWDQRNGTCLGVAILEECDDADSFVAFADKYSK